MSPLVEVRGERVVELVLNRPEARNALSVDLCDALTASLERIDRSPEARVLLVRGEGTVFCSGADFAAVSGPGGLEFLPAFERMLETLARFRLPTIAVIQGAALGGGFQLATVCDFRIAADDADLGIPSSRLGIVVNFENVQRLVLMAGMATAKEILMTGRTFTGDEVVQRGLAHHVVAAGELEAKAHSMADDIASRAPLSVQGAKRTIMVVTEALANARETSREHVEQIDDLVMRAYNSRDLQEGIKAMTEKRDPDFEGI